MSFLTAANTANQQWKVVLGDVLRYGKSHSPRGKLTYEWINYRSTLDMRYPVITIPSRRLGYRFLFAEALWILSGDNRVETIAPYAKAITNFSDDGYRFQGAYGPKVTEQLRYVVETLCLDPDSRQAVLTVWRENPRSSKDIPCTISLQFLIRDNQIHTIATMRSSDLWLGWVYDVFNFTMITAWIAVRIYETTKNRISLGKLHLNAGSQHIYDINKEDAEIALQDDGAWSYQPLDVINFNTPADLMNHLQCLRDIKNQLNLKGWLAQELLDHVK